MAFSTRNRCWAEIDLAALERNLGKIRNALPPHIAYIAVVKADAYGHGMAQTVARLMQSNADGFAVANVAEAVEIREIGTGWPILVLSALLPEEDEAILEYDLTATVSSAAEVNRLNALAKARNATARVHLKIDTGMGRIGVWHTQAPPLFEAIQEASHVRLDGIFTHFSSADTDPAFTREQRQRFLNVLNALPSDALENLMIHADNSAGLETLSPTSPFNAVRVGLLQFGLVPYPNSLLSRLKPEPVLSFHSRISLIRSLPAGVPISYCQTHSLSRESRLGILTAGYGDGVPMAFSNRGEVLVRGRRCPILGRVTMDQTVIDLTDHPNAQSGDVATLIGLQGTEQIDVAEFARRSNTIPWDTFTSITKRVPRIYKTARE